VPEYVCQRDGIEHIISICQRVMGGHIDNAVGQLLVESVAPLALEVSALGANLCSRAMRMEGAGRNDASARKMVFGVGEPFAEP
jgi:hypothetical protein